jgi:hypothetical protein
VERFILPQICSLLTSATPQIFQLASVSGAGALPGELPCDNPLRMLLLHFLRQPTPALAGVHWSVRAGGGWHSILNEMILGANHYSNFPSGLA